MWASPDGGASWGAGAGGADGLDLEEAPPIDGGPKAVLALGASSALIVLRGGTVYRTDDAGQTWAAVGRAPEIRAGGGLGTILATTATLGPDGRLYVGLLETGAGGEGWLYRTAERVTAAVAEVEAPSAGPAEPLTVGPGGGTLRLALTVTNTTDRPLSTEVWTEVEGPVRRGPVFGPVPVTLAPGETLRQSLGQRVPSNAPAGSYRYVLKVGCSDCGPYVGAVISGDHLAFVKEAGAVPPGRGEGAGWAVSGWSVSGWTEQASEDMLRVSVSPNPSRGRAEVAFALAEASAVTASVYDVLGRRVAVLYEGPLEAGRYALRLSVPALPPGVYVVRVVAGGEAASRTVTLLR